MYLVFSLFLSLFSSVFSRTGTGCSFLHCFKFVYIFIDHTNLLLKLRDMNFSIDSLQLLSNYLKGRKQYVQVEDKTSSIKSMFFGVPQGSILGPVLFNLYVVELSDQIISSSIQYADDTTSTGTAKLKTYCRLSRKWRRM